jgi:hypothetical protein
MAAWEHDGETMPFNLQSLAHYPPDKGPIVSIIAPTLEYARRPFATKIAKAMKYPTRLMFN